jgi:hypothetical protein
MLAAEVQILSISFTVPQLEGIQRYLGQPVELVYLPVEGDGQRSSDACTSV